MRDFLAMTTPPAGSNLQRRDWTTRLLAYFDMCWPAYISRLHPVNGIRWAPCGATRREIIGPMNAALAAGGLELRGSSRPPCGRPAPNGTRQLTDLGHLTLRFMRRGDDMPGLASQMRGLAGAGFDAFIFLDAAETYPDAGEYHRDALASIIDFATCRHCARPADWSD